MTRTSISLAIFFAAAGCGSQDPEPARTQNPLTVHCEDDGQNVPDEAWLCPEPRTLECGVDADVYTLPPSGSSCSGVSLYATPQALPTGEHDVSVRVVGSDEEVCSSHVTVVDTVPPHIQDLESELWPPNHGMHSISVQDCAHVVDACDGKAQLSFTYASSDEPFETVGDGNAEPDIQMLSCDTVALRAERSGTLDGRVYRLGVRAVDDAGNVSTGECHVYVPHDQSSPAVAGAPVESLPICP